MATISRKTKETEIKVSVNLDGTGQYQIRTDNGFLTHMLEQLSHHSLIDISVEAVGDAQIDMHHQAEDLAITLGEAMLQALGDKLGIARYGFYYVPMDEALTRCVLDLCNRPAFVWDVKFERTEVGGLETELIEHFFSSMANALRCNLHLCNLYGRNAHHVAESCFKAFAKSLRKAIEFDTRRIGVSSTKGVL